MTVKVFEATLRSASTAKWAIWFLLSVLLLTLLTTMLGTTARAQPTSFNEAPQLAQRVAAGELPPVEERLPDDPMIVPVVENIGQYGGTWRNGVVGSLSQMTMMAGYEPLVRWNPEWTGVIPNVAESFEANEDATQFTFRLREGMKWSDGHPFTADDILFWYEDVAMNTDLSPGGPPGWMIVGGEPGVVRKLDDYTVVFEFSEPNGLFLQRLATPDAIVINVYPRHYLEQFHIRHNPDGIDALVREAGVTEWEELWAQRAGAGAIFDGSRWQNLDLPVIYPWKVTVPFGAGTRVVVERNPYYWKVDPEGNQLPYIDRMTTEVAGDVEVLVLRAMAGEIDMQHLRIATLANRPVFFDNMERGNYGFFDTISTFMNTAVIAVNLNHRDPVMREIFQNKDFRIGLSHAIDRQEIIDLVYQAQGEPWQAAPRPESQYYNERLAKQFTEYDVELANEHLDRAGYIQRDAQGFRLGPDGQRISFVVLGSTDFRAEHVDVLEQIQRYWGEVGIDVQIQNIARALLTTRLAANEHDALIFGGDGGGPDAILDTRWYFPSGGASHQAMAWAAWYTDPTGAATTVTPEEPPEIIKRQMELYDQLKATADPDRQTELFAELLEITADEFHVLGINLEPPGYGIVSNDMRNVPNVMYQAWLWPTPGPTNPEQYFFERGQ